MISTWWANLSLTKITSSPSPCHWLQCCWWRYYVSSFYDRSFGRVFHKHILWYLGFHPCHWVHSIFRFSHLWALGPSGARAPDLVMTPHPARPIEVRTVKAICVFGLAAEGRKRLAIVLDLMKLTLWWDRCYKTVFGESYVGSAGRKNS